MTAVRDRRLAACVFVWPSARPLHARCEVVARQLGVFYVFVVVKHCGVGDTIPSRRACDGDALNVSHVVCCVEVCFSNERERASRMSPQPATIPPEKDAATEPLGSGFLNSHHVTYDRPCANGQVFPGSS